MKYRRVLVLLWVLFLYAASQAQDQVITINDLMTQLPQSVATIIGDPVRVKLDRDKGRSIIAQTLVPSIVSPSSLDNPDFYCIIHILKWKDDKSVDVQDWYLYQGGGGANGPINGTRIFGKKQIALLYIHLNVSRADIPVRTTYRVEVAKKLPYPIQSLLSLVNIVGIAAVAPPDNYYGGRMINIEHVPSDIAVKALVPPPTGNELQEIGKQTYDNEGRYYWDVSVGLPVNKIKELEFNAQDGTVRAKEIDRQKLLAFFNFFPQPLDTKGTKFRAIPHAIVGVALSKNPLDRIVVGGGWGLNKVQFFAGIGFNKVQSPATLATGDSASQAQLDSDLRSKYEKKFVFGLNLPVRQVLDALKK